MKISIYIDGNNLYRGGKDLGYKIDYNKFRGWLRQKYNPEDVFLFLGYLPANRKYYEYLSEIGFKLIFKQVLNVHGIVKGNCDAELVLKVTSDYYMDADLFFILITGDGDFACLVEFLVTKGKLHSIIAPDKNRCSFLIRNKNCEILFLNDHYHKFSILKEKTPDIDVSM